MKKNKTKRGTMLIDSPLTLKIMSAMFAAMGMDEPNCVVWAERWADDATVELCFGRGPTIQPAFRFAMRPDEARQVAGWLHPRDEA